MLAFFKFTVAFISDSWSSRLRTDDILLDIKMSRQVDSSWRREHPRSSSQSPTWR